MGPLYFYFVKSRRVANNLPTTEARVQISTHLEVKNFLVYVKLNLKNYHILFNKISPRFLITTRLFCGRKSLIGALYNTLLFYNTCHRILKLRRERERHEMSVEPFSTKKKHILIFVFKMSTRVKALAAKPGTNGTSLPILAMLLWHYKLDCLKSVVSSLVRQGL
jgi:hypothetical protein